MSNFAKEVFQLANRHNAEPDELVLVLAEVLAATAANLDLNGYPAKIEDRLDVFVDRVRERHPQIMQELVQQRAKGAKA